MKENLCFGLTIKYGIKKRKGAINKISTNRSFNTTTEFQKGFTYMNKANSKGAKNKNSQ